MENKESANISLEKFGTQLQAMKEDWWKIRQEKLKVDALGNKEQSEKWSECVRKEMEMQEKMLVFVVEHIRQVIGSPKALELYNKAEKICCLLDSDVDSFKTSIFKAILGGSSEPDTREKSPDEVEGISNDVGREASDASSM